MSFIVRLTKEGQQAAAHVNALEGFGALYPPGEFAPSVQLTDPWTATNDLLLLLGGYWGEEILVAGSSDFRDVLTVVQERLGQDDFGCDMAEAAEALRYAATHGLIEGVQFPDWLLLCGCIDQLQALGNRLRLQLLWRLLELGPATMADLSGSFSVPDGSLYFHLRRLVQAGLVHKRREDRLVYYSASAPALRALASRMEEVSARAIL